MDLFIELKFRRRINNFYQLINNLFSRVSWTGPRLGRRWKELNHIRYGFSSILLITKHDRKEVNTSHYSSEIFRTDVTKVLHIQQTKYQTYWLTFQIYKTIYSSMWWPGEGCRRFGLISPTRAILLGENFLQNQLVDSDAI